MAPSRRSFIQCCLMAAGAAALGGAGTPALSDMPILSGDARNPGYLELERSGELERRERALWAMLKSCSLCPRQCHVDRLAGEKGVCGSAEAFRVASYGPDFGNEQAIRGTRGSGGFFLSHCNLLCVFCQNWQINHRGDGKETSHAKLASMMLELQRRGCHNIGFITPTHLVPHLVKALRIAIAGGLHLPLCYNTSSYDSLEVIQLLDGVFDIYQADFKYQDSTIAARFSHGASDYVLHASAAIKEMHRQVGALQQTDGLAHRGLIVRHLVMPENVAGTDVFVRWVASELGSDTHVNIMGQYRPEFRANKYPPLDRQITQAEFAQAMRWTREAGLQNFH